MRVASRRTAAVVVGRWAASKRRLCRGDAVEQARVFCGTDGRVDELEW
jgi:hypothetical protein